MPGQARSHRDEARETAERSWVMRVWGELRPRRKALWFSSSCCGRPHLPGCVGGLGPRRPAPPRPLSHEEPSPTAQQIWDVKRVGSPGVHTHIHTQTWTLGGGVQTPHYSMMSACLVLKGDGPIQWGLENPILWGPMLLLTAEGAAGLESP